MNEPTKVDFANKYCGRTTLESRTQCSVRFQCQSCKLLWIYTTKSIEHCDLLAIEDGWRFHEGQMTCRECLRKSILDDEPKP